MAKYAQLHTDDGLAVLKAGLSREYVLALTFIAQHEDVAIPVREFEKAVKKLAEIGVELTLQRTVGKTLSDNARSKRYYGKTQETKKDSHVRTSVSPHVEPHKDLLLSPSPSLNPSPAEKVSPMARKPSKGKLALDAWCEAVKTETGTRSAEQGKTLEAIASKLQDIAAESGDTFIDIVRRRVALNKSLQIRWAAQDYATDKTQKPWKRANPLDCGNSDKWDQFEKDWKNPYGETM